MKAPAPRPASFEARAPRGRLRMRTTGASFTVLAMRFFASEFCGTARAKSRRAGSRKHRRKRPAVGPAAVDRARRILVTRMERSDIRERFCKLHWRPWVSLCSTQATKKEENKIREAERRQTQTKPPHHTGAAPPPRGRHAYRRSTAALTAANQRRRSAPATRFLGRGFGSFYSAVACPSPAFCTQAGRNAGRASSQSRPRTGLRAPPAGAAPAPITGRRR